MGSLPFRIDDRGLPNLDDAITGAEASLNGCSGEVHVRPMIPMAVNVVSNFAEHQPFRPQHTIRLRTERGVEMIKIAVATRERLHNQPKASVEVL